MTFELPGASRAIFSCLSHPFLERKGKKRITLSEAKAFMGKPCSASVTGSARRVLRGFWRVCLNGRLVGRVAHDTAAEVFNGGGGSVEGGAAGFAADLEGEALSAGEFVEQVEG